MDILSEVYYKTAAENEKNLRFWQDYLKTLNSLDFSVFGDKLKVPVLVPIGNRILFRGELKHTNEVTVALGADYFVKCSLKQAEVLKQHRIKDAQSKIDQLNKEKEYLENQISFTRETANEIKGQEILEFYSEEEDKAWREQHRQNVKKYKQNKGKEKVREEKNDTENITDEELWNRLEELELQEELENELSLMNGDNFMRSTKDNEYLPVKEEIKKDITNLTADKKEIEEKCISANVKTITAPKQRSKLDLLQQVIDKQNELEEKLYEIKNRERTQNKTENELILRLDELEKLDELEDEMERLDDIIENEDTDEEEKHCIENKPPKNVQRSVSFVDDDDSETLQINFKHSPVEPQSDNYDPDKGIQKPSDIYVAYSKLFVKGTTSILSKKSKYENTLLDEKVPEVKHCKPKVQFETDDTDDDDEHETIVIKDVVENVNQTNHTLESQARPTSLFKKKRMQNK